MMTYCPVSFNCSCAVSQQNAIDEVMRHPHIATARRLHALLDVLDILTEKPTLTESDMAALDVILDAARRQVSEIIWLSEQSPKGMAG